MNASRSATGELRDDHQLILKVLDALDSILTAETAHTELDFGGLRDCITFFRLFADACHHGKEEDLLFPRLVEEGLPGDSGPIAALLEDHELGRSHVATMANSIDAAEAGDVAATNALRDAALAYLDLLRDHIAKEDFGVFEMADGMLVGEACRSLCDSYAVVCSRKFDGRTLDDLENLANAVSDRYSAL